jgi:DNA segregation ATPase FtsK/SpoIIIE, S-DNA-T family
MIRTILKWTINFLFSLAGEIIVWVTRCLWRLGLWTGRMAIAHPRTSLGAGILGAAVYVVGWETCLVLLGMALITGSTWKAAHPVSFERLVLGFLRTWMRRWWAYSRVWCRVMQRADLMVEVDGERLYPLLTKVATTEYWDRLELKMVDGAQEVGDFRQAAERLRHAWRAERIAVREIKPASVGIDLMRRDPFRYETVSAFPMPETTAEIDFTALPVGLTEHLRPFTVSVVGGHLAVAGGSNSGKAGAEWGILRALAPAIADGVVKPVFIDPKGRELRQGRDLVAKEDYAVKDHEVLDLLQRLVAEMEAVHDSEGESGERDFTPSQETPLRLILIDELAPLLAYWKRSVRDKIEDCLGLLLTQGRAAGYILVGEIQEPTKDVFKIRDLFPRRIGLRLPTEDHTDAALTDKAADRGALCHEIPEDLPGVFFAYSAGAKSSVRARLGYVRDEDIRELVDFVQQRRTVTSIDSRRRQIGGEQAA